MRRNDTHDAGGWLVEWEGHKHEQRPGWLHPAVYSLVAATYSFDMEQRRLKSGGSSALWQQAARLLRAARGRMRALRARLRRRQADGR